MTDYYTARRIVTVDQILVDGWVAVDGGRITDVGVGTSPAPAHEVGEWLLPGYVDIHCHGGGGTSFDGGAAEARAAASFHERAGTTRMLASLVTAPLDILVSQVGGLAALLDEAALGPVRGIHLEGPYLSPDFRGAHDPAALQEPDAESIARLLSAGRGWIAMVTLAPELPGATDAAAQLREAGVVVAVGHTAADYEQASAAFADGARVLTHACNAMPGVHHRAPGPLVAALESPEVHLELILDGIHLHDAWARHLLLDARDRAVLITDAMAAAGAEDGRYDLGGLDVDVRDGVARLADSGSIAGSTLLMSDAVRHAVVDLGIDPVATAQAASTSPAAVLGWGEETGRIDNGAVADLVVLDEAHAPRGVMRDGGWVVAPSVTPPAR